MIQTKSARFLPVDLTGQTVLITAGAAGIGRVIAEGFAMAGAKVHVCDVNPTVVETIRRERPDFSVTQTDVADPEQVDDMFKTAVANLGEIDILVNNAGIAGPTAGIEDVEPDALRQTLSVDLESMFHCARRAVPHMKRTGAGVIINLGSIAGRLSFAMRSPYSTAKWGVVGFTKSLALELGVDNIRVNAVLPGHVNTTRFRSVAADRAKTLGVTPKEMEARFLEPVAMGTTVEPEDIANMALFLSSPFGARITGQALSVCAGVEMMR
ncbi:SDR family oxidoreductase [Lentibacter algarum]|uniref:SDR family oxidoreductase n=1 Tax=Lentibacter algarum TaxID=576131 RepID=UPI001C0689C5|nr:SDR family oxidoreductase [Lentibacter algarum]MBU2980190.1 SDR family oxidoreductase [Lentibacter algarum]